MLVTQELLFNANVGNEKAYKRAVGANRSGAVLSRLPRVLIVGVALGI